MTAADDHASIRTTEDIAVLGRGVGVMSQLSGKASVAIIDGKELRRASINSLLERWAKNEKLRLASFSPDQAREVLHVDQDFRMLILSVGGDSIAETEYLQQVKVLRALVPDVPLVIISDREDTSEITTAFTSGAQGFIHSGISSVLAYQALSFVLNGGSYFPPSAIQQLQDRPEQNDKPRDRPSEKSDSTRNRREEGGRAPHLRADLEYQSAKLTARQLEVLEHLRRGESNKVIAHRLGMTEGTVKVHIRQMMRKCKASNRTQLAIGRAMAPDHGLTANDSLTTQEITPRGAEASLAPLSPAHGAETESLAGSRPRSRLRMFGKPRLVVVAPRT